MKKTKTKQAAAKLAESASSGVNEPYPVYFKTIKVIPSLKDFTYNEFKKI